MMLRQCSPPEWHS